jgi:hypothetical protein
LSETTAVSEKKRIERWFLEAARRVSSLIPDGKIEDFEKPDFTIMTPTGSLGIEVSEVLRAGRGPLSPVEEENIHEKIIRRAKQEYISSPDSVPVRVYVSFWNPEGKKLNIP